MGVVAVSNDIGFDIPPSVNNYDDKADNQKDREYTACEGVANGLHYRRYT